MFMTKLKIATALLLAVGFVSAGAAQLTHSAVAEQQPVVPERVDAPTQEVQDQKKTDEKKTEQSNIAEFERRFTRLEGEIAKLVKEVQSLRRELKAPGPQPEANGKIKLFRLNNAKAPEIVKTLRDLLQAKDGGTPRIASHETSNTVLVLGNPELLKMVETVIAALDGE